MRRDAVTFRGGLHVDMWLMFGLVAIATFGVVNLYSATSPYAEGSTISDIYISQIYWIVVGILAGVLVAAIDYRHYERLAYVLYGAGVASLALVFVLGKSIRGTVRWIEYGGFTFQPSEFSKLVLILVIAKLVHDDPKTEPRTLFDLLPAAVFMAVPVALVMAQPDLGTSLIYLLNTGTMLAMTKIRRRTVAGILAGGLTFSWISWNYLMHGYQKDRITSFLDPESNTDESWHAEQSMTAIGNGGLTGEGFTQGTQNQFGFLPDQFSDFPFAVFAEDWGFVGCLALLALYCFVCIWAIHVASQAKDRFGAALAIGIGAFVFWHTLANIGMATGVLPVVGVTLPLFSYGGSSIVSTMIGFGLLTNVSMRR